MKTHRLLTESHIGNLSKAFPAIGKHFDFKGRAVLQVHRDDLAFVGQDKLGKLKEIVVFKNGWILCSEFRAPKELDLLKVSEILSGVDMRTFPVENESVDKIIEATANAFIKQAMEFYNECKESEA